MLFYNDGVLLDVTLSGLTGVERHMGRLAKVDKV